MTAGAGMNPSPNLNGSGGSQETIACGEQITKAPRLTGSRCLCRGCGHRFNSVTAFDGHRVDGRTGPDSVTRRCLTSAEMQYRGMSLNSDQFSITEVRRKKPVKTGASQFSAVSESTLIPSKGGAI
jgi:hypothetical protein